MCCTCAQTGLLMISPVTRNECAWKPASEIPTLFDHNTKFLLSVITCNELWIRCYDLEYKHNSSVIIKWLTASAERTHSTLGTVMFIFLSLQCRTHYAKKETWVPYKTVVFAPRHCTAMYCTNDSGYCWCLKHELWGQKLGSNREEMQVTAAVLLKVSEDELLYVFECSKNVWLVKDTVKKGH